eukprot:NODE_622_length_5328_cov_0.497609.p3 type:complete len:186 gc:universal NODE_622_length_5328_cov_0.497609:4395-4952(+)
MSVKQIHLIKDGNYVQPLIDAVIQSKWEFKDVFRLLDELVYQGQCHLLQKIFSQKPIIVNGNEWIILVLNPYLQCDAKMSDLITKGHLEIKFDVQTLFEFVQILFDATIDNKLYSRKYLHEIVLSEFCNKLDETDLRPSKEHLKGVSFSLLPSDLANKYKAFRDGNGQCRRKRTSQRTQRQARQH